MNAPHACYLILASLVTPSMAAIYSLVTIEKFGYGFGSVACILYMMQQVSPGKYRTAHYAFANALAYAGYLLPSMASGWIQVHIGYRNFFLFGLLASIPSVIAAGLAPFHVKEDDAPVVTAAAGH
jgi:PAT family beta-lactamase induction signal transducer AmpG